MANDEQAGMGNWESDIGWYLTQMFKECLSSDDEDAEEPDEAFAEENDYLAITHHEQVPVIVRNRQ